MTSNEDAAPDKGIELKACPFCGSKSVRTLHIGEGSRGWVVRCFGVCPVRPESGEGTRQGVIDAWNTRAPLAPPVGELVDGDELTIAYMKGKEDARREIQEKCPSWTCKMMIRCETCGRVDNEFLALQNQKAATQSQPALSVTELNRRIIGLIDYAADYLKTLPKDCMGREQDDPEVGYRGWAYRDEWLHNANEIKALLNGNTGEK